MRVSSSTAIAYASVSVPPPPYSSGIVIPSQAELGQLADELVRETLLAVELLGDRRDPLERELADGLAEKLVLVVEIEVEAHGGPDLRSDSLTRQSISIRKGAHRVAAKDFFDSLESRADESKLAGMSNSYLFDIEGEGEWLVTVARRQDRRCRGWGRGRRDHLDERRDVRQDRRRRAEPDDRLHDGQAEDQGRHGRGHEASEAVLGVELDQHCAAVHVLPF